MNLIVLTPEQEYYKGEVRAVTVPGISGRFEVLDNHAPIVSALVSGQVSIRSAEGTKQFSIEKGFIEVLNNEVALLVQGLTES